jgi:hypothetical protein
MLPLFCVCSNSSGSCFVLHLCMQSCIFFLILRTHRSFARHSIRQKGEKHCYSSRSRFKTLHTSAATYSQRCDSRTQLNPVLSMGHICKLSRLPTQRPIFLPLFAMQVHDHVKFYLSMQVAKSAIWKIKNVVFANLDKKMVKGHAIWWWYMQHRHTVLFALMSWFCYGIQ